MDACKRGWGRRVIANPECPRETGPIRRTAMKTKAVSQGKTPEEEKLLGKGRILFLRQGLHSIATNDDSPNAPIGGKGGRKKKKPIGGEKKKGLHSRTEASPRRAELDEFLVRKRLKKEMGGRGKRGRRFKG